MLPFALLIAIKFATDVSAARIESEQTSLRGARAIVERLVSERSAATTLLEQLAIRPGIRNPAPGQNCGFNGFQPTASSYANLALYDLGGSPVCSGLPWRGNASVSGQSWFQEIKRESKPLVTGPEWSPILQTWVVFHAQPVLDARGAMKAVLVGPIRASHYAEILRAAAAPTPDSVGLIIDRNGSIIARSVRHERWVGKRPAEVEVIRHALGSSSSTFRALGVEGVDRVYGVGTVPGQGWRVLVGIPARVVFAPLRQVILIWSALLVGVFAAFFALSHFAARRIERPIVALVERVQRLTINDTEESLPVEGPAEIASLAESFNEMLRVQTERERFLRNSEWRLAAALDASGAAVWELDVREAIFSFDEAFARMLDLPPGTRSRSQDEIRSFIYPDDRERVLADGVQVVMGPGDRLETEFRNVTPAGRLIWVITAARVVERDDAGIATRLVGCTREITERKRAESRLEQETEFNRTLVNASPAYFVALDPEGRMIVINDALLSALGWEREPLMDQPFDLIVPAYAVDEAHRGFRVVAESKEAVTVVCPVRTRDGQEILVEWRSRPVLSEANEVEFVFAIGIDVGEQRRQEAALLRNADLLAAVNETAMTLLAHHDLAETLQLIATRAASLTGAAGSFVEIYDRERDAMRIVAGTGISAPYIGRELQPGQGMLGSVHRTRQPLVIDDVQQWSGRVADAADVHAAAAIPILSGDHVRGVLGISESDSVKRISNEQVEVLTRLAQMGSIAIDNAGLVADAQREIAERTRAEEEVRRLNAGLEERVRERTLQLETEMSERISAEEALQQQSRELAAMNAELAESARMKDGFLANMSHELRTPLNAILGMTEVLREGIHGSLNAKQERSLEVITASGTHLLELINDILDLSKVEAGMLELDLRPLNVRSLAEASLAMLRETAFRKELTLTLDIDAVVETVDADERRLKQILVNLLSNAVKFTPNGGAVGLTIEGDPRSNEIRFAVRDTGIGIAEAQLGQLFTPFFQADSSYTRQYAGTGLGLSLVRRLAALHAGSVDVRSALGMGSTFTVTLPWRHEGLVPRIEPIAQEQRPAGNLLLIIEDDATAAEQVARHAEGLGLTTVVSDGSEDPIDLVERVHPSAIVLDVLFESSNGWTMLSALKSSRRTATIPVIMVSVVDDPARGLAMGAAAYLVKPINRETLKATLLRFLSLPRNPTTRVQPLILLAEDNDTNIRLMESYLDAMEMRVIIARDGNSAVMAARQNHPDLILMDVQMPVLDGLQVTRLIRESEGPISKIPIIALTALAMGGDRARCLAAGADEYLTKPVSYKDLEEVMLRLLRR